MSERPDRGPERMRNRERILESAGAVVAERGVELTRYADVAERAAVSISTLQYLFGSLDSLLIEVLQRQARGYLERARGAVCGVVDPVQRLGRIIDHFVTADVSASDARADWLVWVEYWRAAARTPELHADARSAYREWREIVADAYDAGVASGRFTVVVDRDAFLDGLLALCDGSGIQIVLGHRRMTRRRASLACRAWAACLLGCPDLASDR